MRSDYFDHLNYAFTFWQIKALNSSARLTYLAILYKWNAFRRPTSFKLTDRELQNLTGLGSNCITSAKRTLKNLGLIAFKASKHETMYSLPDVRCNAENNARSNAPIVAKTAHGGLFTTPSNSSIKERKEKEKGGGAREDFENVEFDG